MAAELTDLSVCDLLGQIVGVLVDHTDAVRITPTEQPDGVCFSVAVHGRETGKLIGKQGQTAEAIRLLLSSIGMKMRRRYTLDITQTTLPQTSPGNPPKSYSESSSNRQ